MSDVGFDPKSVKIRELSEAELHSARVLVVFIIAFFAVISIYLIYIEQWFNAALLFVAGCLLSYFAYDWKVSHPKRESVKTNDTVLSEAKRQASHNRKMDWVRADDSRVDKDRAHQLQVMDRKASFVQSMMAIATTASVARARIGDYAPLAELELMAKKAAHLPIFDEAADQRQIGPTRMVVGQLKDGRASSPFDYEKMRGVLVSKAVHGTSREVVVASGDQVRTFRHDNNIEAPMLGLATRMMNSPVFRNQSNRFEIEQGFGEREIVEWLDSVVRDRNAQ